MKIEDKLKQVKREREVRSRSQKIQETWQKIDQKEDLSVKEKLQRLINLTGGKKEKAMELEIARTARTGPYRFPAVGGGGWHWVRTGT